MPTEAKDNPKGARVNWAGQGGAGVFDLRLQANIIVDTVWRRREMIAKTYITITAGPAEAALV